MWIRRMLALVVAVALVVGALLVRSRVIDHNGGTTTTDTSPAAPGTDVGGVGASTSRAVTADAVTLVCVPELEAVCRSVKGPAVRIEAPGVTLGSLAAAAAPADTVTAWVTFAPWPTIVDDARARHQPRLAAAFGAGGREIGRSTTMLATLAGRAKTLAGACGGTVTWSCIGDKADASWEALGGQRSWGLLNPAHANPKTSASGLAALGALLAQKAGSAGFSPTDTFVDPAFTTWIGRLERAVPKRAFAADDTPLARLLQQPDYGVVATTSAELDALPAGQQGRLDRIELAQPFPVSVAAVVAPVAGVTIPAGIVDQLIKAAGERRWAAPSSTVTNTPPAASLEAAQKAWEDEWQ